ncbi:MAG: hypothetical protein ACO1SV_20790 [Fimbriimonas sp.]
MKDSQLDARIQAAYPSAPVPATLDGRIVEGVERHRRSRLTLRRAKLAVGVVGLAATMTVMGPPVYAQAMVSRMAGALDGVTTMRLTRISVDSAGRRVPAGEVLYDGGRWRIRASGEDILYAAGQRYVLDPLVHAYVLSEQSEGPFANGSIRLSEMLGESGHFSLDRRVRLDEAKLEGRTMRRATVDNPNLNERYVIYADPRTDLPQEIHVQSQEEGRWRLRMVQSLVYGAAVPRREFELPTGAATITEEERGRRVVGAMTSEEIASLPHRKGRLIVRAVDVAKDGTVYVAYQSGDRMVNSHRGFAFDLSDDRGTAYARRETFGGANNDFLRYSKAGKLELEVFVPLTPVDTRRPRTYSLLTRRFKNGGLARMIRTLTSNAQGVQTLNWQPNWQGTDLTPPSETVLVKKRFEGATCESAPSYAQLVMSEFRNEIATSIFTTGTRAKELGNLGRWEEATRWYEEQLRLIRRHESMGLGPYSEDDARQKLEEIRNRAWKF